MAGKSITLDDLTTYAKTARNLIEGDVVQKSTGEGVTYIFIDTTPVYSPDDSWYECYIYEITAQEIIRYFNDSDIQFRLQESKMELWQGIRDQWVTCLETKLYKS